MLSGNKKKIYFGCKLIAPFVQDDINILSENFEVDVFQIKPGRGFLYILRKIIHQFFILLFNIRKYHIIFIWFADYHAFFPVWFAHMFRKKSYVVNGGYDVNVIADINYGIPESTLRYRIKKYIFRKVSFSLPAADSFQNKIKKIEPNAKVKVIYTGYDENKFDYVESKRSNIIITVANINTEQRFYVKGIDRFIKLAKIVSNYQFIIIGVDKKISYLFNDIPENLKVYGLLSNEELIPFYRKAFFYAQFSRTEAICGTLCESMLCGCIPLVMNVGDMKKVAGGYGKCADEWDESYFLKF